MAFNGYDSGFGMVGHGWTYRIARTWSEKCENGSVMCFSEVAVKTKLNGQWGEEFFGIGGSEIVEKNKNGISCQMMRATKKPPLML